MESSSLDLCGRVAGLFLHPLKSGATLQPVEFIEVVANEGIRDNGRYFQRKSRLTGKPSRRQVSLIGQEQINEHAIALGLRSIPPGVVRSNIETTGIDLMALLDREVAVGEAILRFYEPRTPCQKMDAICNGLRTLMENGRQGMLAEVIRSGRINIGDVIQPAGSHLSG